jgi:hypothetical protein
MARRTTQSPLATFLDYILTAPLAVGQAALEACSAALAARTRVFAPPPPALVPAAPATPRTRRPRAAKIASAASVPAIARDTPTAAVHETPAAAPATPIAPRRRGRPRREDATATAAAPVRRRRRVAAADQATAAAPAVIADPPIPVPAAAELPEQGDYDVVEE